MCVYIDTIAEIWTLVEGIVKEETAATTDETDKKKKKTVKVLRKIPPKVIKEAKGIVIFTAMRSGIAPFGGAGGSGVVVARLEDGCRLCSTLHIYYVPLMFQADMIPQHGHPQLQSHPTTSQPVCLPE